MKTSTSIIAICLAAATTALQAAELPIVFARSGQKIAVPVGGDGHRKTAGGAVLWAYRQSWGEVMKEKDGSVEFIAPEVRATVVFQMVSMNPADDSYRRMSNTAGKMILGELVVYCQKSLPWDKDTQLVAFGTPRWFDTWAEAVGLPVQKLNDRKSLDAGAWRMLEKPGLLVVGSDNGDSLRLSEEHKINVLALDLDWIATNETVVRKMVLSPKQMTGALADLQVQQWPLPPAFGHRVLEVTNRQAWIEGPDHPLVEEIRSHEKDAGSLRIVWSYLPWQDQLGRKEMADELLLRILTETAKGAKDRSPLTGRWVLLYPAAREIDAGERPILAAAMKSTETNLDGDNESKAVRAYVLDLRGKISPLEDFFASGAIKTIENRIGLASPLLILGDNPTLDAWKWLALDRSRHQSPKPGVVWLSDGSLPPSISSQLRLMQLFTEWNISLESNSKE